MVGTANHISFLLFPRIFFPSCPGITPDPWLGKLILSCLPYAALCKRGKGGEETGDPREKALDQQVLVLYTGALNFVVYLAFDFISLGN